MPIVTELTRKLGIRVPIVQGGMMHIGTADLAAAVSNAGGLGIITALIFTTPAALRDEIRRCRTLTKKPFAVNMTLLPSMVPPDYPAYAQTIIDEGIKVVETAGNSPGPIIKQLKAADIIVLHKCTTIRHALSAVKLGVDFLSIDGFECAGHVGESDITNFILLSRARQELSIPFIASGGFADGQGLAAALCLGASGINMGTRFMCTVEAPLHENIKKTIVKSDENQTALVLRRWRNTSRLFKNKVTEDALKIERESTTGEFSEIAPYVSGKRGKEVFSNGDPEHGVWTTGQVMGLIHDIPTCDVLVKRIEKEAETTLNERVALVVPESKLLLDPGTGVLVAKATFHGLPLGGSYQVTGAVTLSVEHYVEPAELQYALTLKKDGDATTTTRHYRHSRGKPSQDSLLETQPRLEMTDAEHAAVYTRRNGVGSNFTFFCLRREARELARLKPPLTPEQRRKKCLATIAAARRALSLPPKNRLKLLPAVKSSGNRGGWSPDGERRLQKYMARKMKEEADEIAVMEWGTQPLFTIMEE
ncbi:2-nitropropane dioxygenase family [Cordyceps militaris]|uniref:2-nitropropane dioxygenase family n=1 Tax=Cordyceps militaris TaxID=73501 RepID=A0A2H4STL5_CORMI|nr:2-nitropropane dioxygenase family [Cordyceps militaris]